MSQQSILDLLTKNKGKWYSRKDFECVLDVNKKSLSKSMKQLVKFRKIYELDFEIKKHNKFFLRKK